MARPRKRSASIALFSVVCIVAGIVSAMPASAQQFLTINFPGAASTAPETINNVGQVVGSYIDSEGVTHGFLLSAGVFTSVDYPGAIGTSAAGINNNGQIVGFYLDSNKLAHGFSLNNGTFTAINDPAFPGATYVIEISDPGLIVGYGIDGKGVYHGFTLNNNVFTTLDFPGSNYSVITDVNYNGSEIVGVYSLPSFAQDVIAGFKYVNGVFISVNFPESASTGLNGVNNGEQIVGTYLLPDQTNANVFLLTGNTFTIEDFPGAAATGAADLNDLDEIVGAYIDVEGANHGYLETSGPFVYVAGSVGVTELDATTDLTVASIPLSGAYELALTPDQSLIYVADSSADTVSAINTGTNTVVSTIKVGDIPDGVAVTPNGGFVYVANNGGNNPQSNTVSVISTDSNTVVQTITVGPAPFLPKVTPDGTHVYVANQNNTISVIDTATNTVSSTIQVDGPTGLAFTPNGAFAYVAEYTNPGTVAVLAIPSNTLVTTIPLGAGTTDPIKVAITPDGSLAYVANLGSNNVSVINTATNTVLATIPVGTSPYGIAASADGTLVYVGNVGDSTLSIISTATNTVISTLPVSDGVSGIAVGGSPLSTQEITQTLSPTAPNTFNFGTNSFVVQYPAGTSFSGVNMTVEAVEMTQQQFDQRVAGTQFANASCIVYAGAGGNCVDYEVTCSNAAGTPIACPSESTPSIAVQTSFTTLQGIVNPGFLTTPIGENDWTNIFSGFSDTTIKGRTKGFSEFVAVDLGASNGQGLGTLAFLAPLQATNSRTFAGGATLPLSFQLASVSKPGQFITDAVANLTLQLVANAAGQAQSTVVLALSNPFHLANHTYSYELNTTGYAPGVYVLSVYGNAFAAQQVQFTITSRSATTCVIRSSSPLFSTGETLTFTGSVQPAAASSTAPTGTITFYDSAYSRVVLGTATLSGGGIASIRHVLKAPPDRQWLEFIYPGDNNFLPCTSQELPEDDSNSK
jgi:YVTN family beta-propeller protein